MKNKKKSITLRKEFWRRFKEDVESKKVYSSEKLESYYTGYAEGLKESGMITEEQRDEMIEVLKLAIFREKISPRRQIKKEETKMKR